MDALQNARSAIADAYAAAHNGEPGQERITQRRARTYAAVAQAEALTRIAEVLEANIARPEAGDPDHERVCLVLEGHYPDIDLASLAQSLRKDLEAMDADADTESLRDAAPYPEESDFERGHLCGLKSSDAYQQGLARGREDNAAELEAWQNAPRWQPVDEPLHGYALCRLMEPGTEANDA